MGRTFQRFTSVQYRFTKFRKITLAIQDFCFLYNFRICLSTTYNKHKLNMILLLFLKPTHNEHETSILIKL